MTHFHDLATPRPDDTRCGLPRYRHRWTASFPLVTCKGCRDLHDADQLRAMAAELEG